MTDFIPQEASPLWKCSSCAVQGRAHIRNGTPCQDKTLTSYAKGVYTICLSDGAGSAKLSHYGAECVVNSICELLINDFDGLYAKEDGREVKITIVNRITEAIRKESDSLCCEPTDLAATMLAVAVKDTRFIAAHIGDGVVGCLKGTELKVISIPSNGEHANETYFVTSGGALNTMTLFKGSVDSISGFVIMSDGTEHSLYNKKNNTLSNAIIKLMQRNVLIGEEIMNSQLEKTFRDIIATRTHDDCSIAILCRNSETLRSFDQLSIDEKCEVFNIADWDNNKKKRIKRYEEILDILNVPHTCPEVAKKIHLKARFTRNHLDSLCAAGLAVVDNGKYQTT